MELACALHFSGTALTASRAAKLVAKAGFTALEVSPWIPCALTPSKIKTLKTSLRKNDLTFSGLTAIYPPDMTLATPSIYRRRRNIAYTKQLIEVVHDLEGRTIVWGSGRARTIPRDVPFKRGYAWLVELLRASGSLADEKQVRVAIEPLNRFESTIIHNVKEALSLAKLVNRRSVGIVFDTFQASLEEDSFTKPILLAGKRLAAVHVSDCNRKIPGRGHLDFVAIFDALRKVKYDGYVTLEAILGGNLLADLVAARKYLEKVMG